MRPDPDSFIPRYVFPYGDMLSLTVMTAGFEGLAVEALRPHYALTLRAWVQNFENRLAGVNQVLVQRPGGDEPPLRRTGRI